MEEEAERSRSSLHAESHSSVAAPVVVAVASDLDCQCQVLVDMDSLVVARYYRRRTVNARDSDGAGMVPGHRDCLGQKSASNSCRYSYILVELLDHRRRHIHFDLDLAEVSAWLTMHCS